MAKKQVIHYRSMSLYNNSGMQFPECFSDAPLIDTDKSRLPTTGRKSNVTCKNCRRSRRFNRV